MNVLDLFSGKGGATAAMRERGHRVVTLDLGVDGDFVVDHRLDILEVRDLADLVPARWHGPECPQYEPELRDRLRCICSAEPAFDFIWASPPCTAFSVAAMGKNWQRTADGRGIAGPKHPRAELGMRIAQHTFRLVDAYVAAHPGVRYVIENPVGALRVMPFLADRSDRRTTWYCQWDDRRPGVALPRAKPTDLWTNIGGDWPSCRQGAPDHEAAPRGARTGTQGLATAAERSLVPYRLSLAVCAAVEGHGVLVPDRPAAAPALFG